MAQNGLKHELDSLSSSPPPSKKRKTASPTPSVSFGMTDPDPDWQVTYLSMQSYRDPQDKDYKRARLAEPYISAFTDVKEQADGTLDRCYIVSPTDKWQGMRKYNSFVIDEVKYHLGEYVWVKHGLEPQTKTMHEKDFWIGKILEIRGATTSHVYALVNWMYWPEDLPLCQAPNELKPISGRRGYHGRREVIASNVLDAIPVLTCAGKVDVIHWLEEDDEDAITTPLYWRQTFNEENNELSGVRLHCVCDQPYNPDTTLLGCENPMCHIWLHKECILDDILTKTHDRLIGPLDDEQKRKLAKSKTSKKCYTGKFKADFKGDAMVPDVTITDIRKGQNGNTWTEAVYCPKCGFDMTSDRPH
ncbi:hypothetical protein BP5796_05949 [Coleophoma crateriformis]|uniref:BAH domain-containing protein n=1 Tax=Coleophoma crateriformis TaxID=565419 RepID=A0A3D8RVL1_9HELO|nr:hypothetical protein BP5796_05949 [Coleophoma crateriformis]